MVRLLAWMTFLTALFGGILEIELIRRICMAFLRAGDAQSAYITLLVFIVIVCPSFVLSGWYAKRHMGYEVGNESGMDDGSHRVHG
jgi:hypothetical protein